MTSFVSKSSKLGLWLALLMLPFAAQANDMSQPSAHDVVSQAAFKIVEVMKKDTDVKKQELPTVLRQTLTPMVDFERFSKAVMGKHYEAATPTQRTEFTNVLTETMFGLYTKVLLKFDIANLEVQYPTEDKPFKGSVSMKVTTDGGDTYNISYSVRQNPQKQWKVRNMILDGINLGLAYRNQFNGAAQRYNGNISMVISNWSAEMDDNAVATK